MSSVQKGASILTTIIIICMIPIQHHITRFFVITIIFIRIFIFIFHYIISSWSAPEEEIRLSIQGPHA
jgi:hypothetical protein